MAEKKVTKKIISKAVSAEKVTKEAEEPKEVKVEEAGKSKKACAFCQNKKSPSYTDIATLKRYVTDRAKIVGKAKSNLCSRHQRAVTRHIKYARHLSLLPFTPKV